MVFFAELNGYVRVCSFIQSGIYQQLGEVIPDDLECFDLVSVWLTISFGKDSEHASLVED